MAEPNLTELVTSTLRSRSGETADNVSNGNALLMRVNENGNNRPVSGGRTIVEELEYAENATFKYYSGYEPLDISPSKVMDAAEYNWKQAAVVISMSGLEQIQNAGEEQVLDLLDRRMGNAERTMRNNLSTGIYSDGTGTNGKQITGLQLQVADDPTTGTVGGIARATFSFWRNQKFDPTADGGAAASSTNIEGYMQRLWLLTVRGNDKTDLIMADGNYYRHFWSGLTANQRFQRSDRGVAGFDSLAFNTADVVYDGDSGLPADHMFFLNTTYIHWRPSSMRNMVPIDQRTGVNQDAMVVPIVFAGNLTASNLARQGVLTDS